MDFPAELRGGRFAAPSPRSQRERAARRCRPLIGVEAVICEQRHGEAVHAEGHAAGVRRLRAAAVDAPHLTEMLAVVVEAQNRKSTRLNSSHVRISYAVFCLKNKTRKPFR